MIVCKSSGCCLFSDINVFFNSQWNVETEELAAQEIKLSNLDRFEARWRFENESRDNAGYYASSYLSWLNYGSGLITNIIENLQVHLKNFVWQVFTTLKHFS